jgi:hypothetical protein
MDWTLFCSDERSKAQSFVENVKQSLLNYFSRVKMNIPTMRCRCYILIYWSTCENSVLNSGRV